jgi:hypothetical protein
MLYIQIAYSKLHDFKNSTCVTPWHVGFCLVHYSCAATLILYAQVQLLCLSGVLSKQTMPIARSEE